MQFYELAESFRAGALPNTETKTRIKRVFI